MNRHIVFSPFGAYLDSKICLWSGTSCVSDFQTPFCKYAIMLVIDRQIFGRFGECSFYSNNVKYVWIRYIIINYKKNSLTSDFTNQLFRRTIAKKWNFIPKMEETVHKPFNANRFASTNFYCFSVVVDDQDRFPLVSRTKLVVRAIKSQKVVKQHKCSCNSAWSKGWNSKIRSR